MAQKSDATNRNRSVMVYVRVTMAEKNLLENRAKQAGLTISDWVRSKAIGAKPITQKASSTDEVFLKILAGLGKSGSNLNQIARQLNRKQDNEEFDIPVRIITALLDEFKIISKAIREKLNGSY